MTPRAAFGAWPALLLAACAVVPPADRAAPPAPAAPPGPAAVHPPAPVTEAPLPAADGVPVYLCDDGTRLLVRRSEDEVQLAGWPGGPHRLLRDAGGLTPDQAVYSGPRWRAAFGSGPAGAMVVEAVGQPAAAARTCRRQP